MRRNLTTLEVRDILARYSAGERVAAIADRHKLSIAAISQIAYRHGLPPRQRHKCQTSQRCRWCDTKNPAAAVCCMRCGRRLKY